MKLDRITRKLLVGCLIAGAGAMLLSVAAIVLAKNVPMPNLKASDFIALFALLVSAAALGRPWWNERLASIEVRSEEYRRIRGDRVSSEYRYVVKNHGPAQARSVEITFFQADKPVEMHVVGLNHRTSTPLLHPGEEMHMNMVMTYGQELPEKVVVTWRDRRVGHQSQEFYPSLRDL
ncbi:hypothetical protein ABZ783_23820 [Micromonospora sp. NPDC047738]|uniref:hypothetical protein n=1 Tax=Micromonospora sp. NPDC047738 TaxID=3155741 RepID=UPI0033FFE1DB